jgi:hypothetical protein
MSGLGEERQIGKQPLMSPRARVKLQRDLRQCLSCCASKASKWSTWRPPTGLVRKTPFAMSECSQAWWLKTLVRMSSAIKASTRSISASSTPFSETNEKKKASM